MRLCSLALFHRSRGIWATLLIALTPWHSQASEPLNLHFEHPTSVSAGHPIHAPTKDSHYDYTYDKNGNLVLRRNRKTNSRLGYVYNFLNKPKFILQNGQSVSGYLYDMNGVRIARTNGANESIQSAYFGPLEKDYNTGEVRKYFFLGSKRVAKRATGGDLHFVHQDHLGSASLVSSSVLSHQVVLERKFYEFGAVESEFQETAKEEHSFHDKRLNLEDDSYDFSARQYMARYFRFSTPDTIVPNPSRPQSFNRYAYVSNNPLSRVDPSGHSDYLLNGTSNWFSAPTNWNTVRQEVAANRLIDSGCIQDYMCQGVGSLVGGYAENPNYNPRLEPGLNPSMPLLDNPVSAILGEVAAEIGAFAGNAASKVGGKYFGSAVSFLVASLIPDGTPGPPTSNRMVYRGKGNVSLVFEQTGRNIPADEQIIKFTMRGKGSINHFTTVERTAAARSTATAMKGARELASEIPDLHVVSLRINPDASITYASKAPGREIASMLADPTLDAATKAYLTSNVDRIRKALIELSPKFHPEIVIRDVKAENMFFHSFVDDAGVTQRQFWLIDAMAHDKTGAIVYSRGGAR